MKASTRAPASILAVVAAVLVAAGVVVWLTAPEMTAAFEGFSYQPLEESFPVGAFFLSQQHGVAAGLVVLGLIVAGIALGFRWGSRAAVQRPTAGLPDQARSV